MDSRIISFQSFLLAIVGILLALYVRRSFFNCHLPSIIEKPSVHYDFIIVGAGTAGGVLANRLTEDPSNRVLLIEAGQHESWISRIPLLVPFQILFDDTWNYESSKQTNSHWGYRNQKSQVPRGRFLGGSGQMNFHVYNVSSEPKLADLGPFLSNTASRQDSLLLDSFLKAGVELGESEGGHFSQITNLIRNGQRHGVLEIFLKPAMHRKNLEVLINTEVARITFKDGTPESIVVQSSGAENEIPITKDSGGLPSRVILCAGSLNTAKILLESGIGPRRTLEKLDINVLSDLPVGTNLLDQLTYPIYFNINPNSNANTLNLMKMADPRQIIDYFMHGKGVLSSSHIEGQARFTADHSLILFYSVGATNGRVFSKISNMNMDVYDALFPNNTDPWKEGFIMLSMCMDPKSRGHVTLEKRGDVPPRRKLTIDPNYLAEKSDVDCMIKAIRHALAIGQSPALSHAPLEARAHTPNVKQCSHLPQDFQNDAYVECLVRTAAMTMYHPVGTVPVGTVLEKDYSVKGFPHLYVVDGSVITDLKDDFPNGKIIDTAVEVAAALVQKQS